MSTSIPPIDRRQWLRDVTRYAALGGVGSLAGWLLYKQTAHAAGVCPEPAAANCGECNQAAECRLPQVWQLDPNRCIACDGCQTNCVLDISAVKAVNCFSRCGYCEVCTGYFPTADYVRNTGAENQLCPTGAIRRKFIETVNDVPYFEYTIDEQLCIACGKCVLGCRLMNGSLYLQVRHDRCLNCNECSIAAACPADAFRRVPAASPRLLTHDSQAADEAQARRERAGLKGHAALYQLRPKSGGKA